MTIRGVCIRAGLLAALTGVLCFAPALFASDETRHGNPHAHFRNPDQCPKCHLFHGSQPDPGRFSTEANSVCLECHAKGSLGRFHPVNVRPEEKYRKMCLTCHTAHGAYVSYFLRRSGPDDGFDVLCEACHGKR
jgi:predicted CXXCH cytochrome family protein